MLYLAPLRRRSARRRRRRGRGAAVFGCTALLSAALLLSPQITAGGAEPSRDGSPLLASVTASGSDLTPFRKWQSVLQRYAAERGDGGLGACTAAAPASAACASAEWRHFLAGLRSKSRREQLLAVNREANKRPYVTDLANWGAEDYWATPGEFLAHSGDCEDYAILKFFSLRQLGWTGEELRIVAVHDRRLGIGHAIVAAELDGEIWVLDNQSPEVVAAARVDRYQPVYSLTETSWRLYPASGQVASALSQRAADVETAPPIAGR